MGNTLFEQQIPWQLGTAGSETIHPQYFQAYFGVGVAFELLKKASK